MKIDSFTGDYFFLSNFYEVPVKYQNLIFQNTEAAFHSMKDPKRMKEFTTLNPSEAKKLGRQVSLRKDWETIKDQIMYEVVYAKFSQHKDLKEKLLNTGNAELIEGNTWHDQYWGVFNGFGKNQLGKILMQVRTELKNE